MSASFVKDTHPELRREWDPKLNEDVSFETLRTNSRTNVWWLCARDPKHEWRADIWRRAVKGSGCPYCSGLKVLREASFAALYPNLAAEWHPTLNKKLDPWQLAPMSNRRVWWQCNSVHKHEWSTRLHSRTIYGSGCRQCHNIRNPLSTGDRAVAREWHPTLNGPLTPEGISAGSRKRVWWLCANVPAHKWQASVQVRVRAKTRCPECAKSSPRTKLPPLHLYDPVLASQWHPTRNAGRKAAEFSPTSHFKAWWICPTNPSHAWPALIRNRAKLRHGCPHCSPRTRFVSPGNPWPTVSPIWQRSGIHQKTGS
jgi:putative zinc ribbon protein